MRRIDDAIGAEIVRSNPKYAKASSAYMAGVRHRLRRIALGKCKWSGCEVKPERVQYCDAHAKRVYEFQRKGYALKKGKV